jgi:hypothetical protein
MLVLPEDIRGLWLSLDEARRAVYAIGRLFLVSSTDGFRRFPNPRIAPGAFFV